MFTRCHCELLSSFFVELYVNIFYFNCCWFKLAIRRRAIMWPGARFFIGSKVGLHNAIRLHSHEHIETCTRGMCHQFTLFVSLQQQTFEGSLIVYKKTQKREISVFYHSWSGKTSFAYFNTKMINWKLFWHQNETSKTKIW